MAAFVSCKTDRLDNLRLKIRCIFQIVDTYRWMIEAYVSDFFVKDHWRMLPLSWQHYLENLSFSQLACLLTGDPWCHTSATGSVSPLALLALKCCVQNFSLRRQCLDLDSPHILTAMEQALHSHHSASVYCRRSSECEGPTLTVAGKSPNFKNGQLLDMEHIFRKHVKPKKQHEIQRLGKVISWLCDQTNCKCVVDVGAGLGHLSRLLTFAHGLKVTTVEATDGHAPRASEFDRELEKDILKKLKKTPPTEQDLPSVQGQTTLPDGLPCHVVCTVCPDITTQEFQRLILSRQSQSDPDHAVSTPGPAECSITLSEVKGAVLHTRERELAVKFCREESTSAITVPAKLARRCLNVESCETVQKSVQSHNSHHLNNCVQVSLDSEQGSKLDGETSGGRDVSDAGDSRVLTETNHSNQCHSEDMVVETNHRDICSSKDITTERAQDVASSFVLAGLHACGDLTATLLRVFVNCPTVTGLVSVACCYMRLSTGSDERETAESGYPMSRYLHSIKTHHLTYASRELACHFADAYARRLHESPVHLKIHGYRAALQYVVTQVRSDFQTRVTRLIIKRGAEVPFAQYAQQCFQKLGIDPTQVPKEVMATGESLAAEWCRVVAFYTLRLSLAPLVETLVLLDRMLYLAEHGLSSVLAPVFDSALSPRNFALIARKQPSMLTT